MEDRDVLTTEYKYEEICGLLNCTNVNDIDDLQGHFSYLIIIIIIIRFIERL